MLNIGIFTPPTDVRAQEMMPRSVTRRPDGLDPLDQMQSRAQSFGLSAALHQHSMHLRFATGRLAAIMKAVPS
jgi:hypothetical protein